MHPRGVPENLCVSSRCVFLFLHIGQVSGQALVDLLNHAKENGYAASLKVGVGTRCRGLSEHCNIGYSKLPWGLPSVSLGNGYKWGYYIYNIIYIYHDTSHGYRHTHMLMSPSIKVSANQD